MNIYLIPFILWALYFLLVFSLRWKEQRDYKKKGSGNDIKSNPAPTKQPKKIIFIAFIFGIFLILPGCTGKETAKIFFVDNLARESTKFCPAIMYSQAPLKTCIIKEGDLVSDFDIPGVYHFPVLTLLTLMLVGVGLLPIIKIHDDEDLFFKLFDFISTGVFGAGFTLATVSISALGANDTKTSLWYLAAIGAQWMIISLVGYAAKAAIMFNTFQAEHDKNNLEEKFNKSLNNIEENLTNINKHLYDISEWTKSSKRKWWHISR